MCQSCKQKDSEIAELKRLIAAYEAKDEYERLRWEKEHERKGTPQKLARYTIHD